MRNDIRALAEAMAVMDRLREDDPTEQLGVYLHLLVEHDSEEVVRSLHPVLNELLANPGAAELDALRPATLERMVREAIEENLDWELFERQPQAYREAVLPPEVTARLSVEASVRMGWDRYVGPQGSTVSVDRFGASAPYERLVEAFGFTAPDIVQRVKEILSA